MSERYTDDVTSPPHIVCRTCMTTLDVIEHRDGSGFEYEHAAAVTMTIGNTNHPVDPVLFDPRTMELVGVCDFCSQPGPRWRYPAKSYMDTKSGYGSVDDWAACETCHALIECDDDRSRRQLVQRSLDRWSDAERRVLRPQIIEFHDQFRSHRTGPAEALW